MITDKKIGFFQQRRCKISKSTCLDFIEKEDELFLLIVPPLLCIYPLMLVESSKLYMLVKGEKTVAKMLADFTISTIIEYAFSTSFDIYVVFFFPFWMFSKRLLCLGGHFLWHFLVGPLKRFAWNQACLWKSRDWHLSIPDSSPFPILTTGLQHTDFEH